jgi:hypothetical protein
MVSDFRSQLPRDLAREVELVEPLIGMSNQVQNRIRRGSSFLRCGMLLGSLGHWSLLWLGLEPGECFRTCPACPFLAL